MTLAARLAPIKPSATLAISAKAKEMRAAGVDVLSLAAGEPDFPTPAHVCEAAIQAIKDGHHGYTAADGMPSLKEAVIEKFQKDSGLNYTPAEIVIGCGGKQGIFNLAQATLDPGDEVIIPGPYWVSYPPIVMLAGATPVIIPSDQSTGFKITADQFREACTDQTKAIIICSPSNPTGGVYTKEELLALAEVALEKNVLIWSDEIYEKLVFEGLEFHCMASLMPELKDQVVVLNGVSKTFAMTGWRIGYIAGPEKIARGVAKIQSQSTSNPSTPAQFAAEAALRGPLDAVWEMKEAFDRRRKLICNLLSDMDVELDPPLGAFYVFPDFSNYIKGEIKGSTDLAAFLLEKAHVASVPGEAFGAEGYLRFSYATSDEAIEEGVARIRKALEG